MSGIFVRASKFRHVFGEGNATEKCYTDVHGLCSGESDYIKANGKFFCVAKKAGGGPVWIHNRGDYGRFQLSHPLLNVHTSSVLDFDFNPFKENCIATGSDDCSIAVTVFPEDGLTENINTATTQLFGHSKKISLLKWHPTAPNVIASAAYDHQVRVWDVEEKSEAFCVDNSENLYSLEWNGNGSQLLTTARDRMLRLFDPRTEKVLHTIETHEGTKTTKGFWVDNMNMVGCVGFSKSSQRRILFWDQRKMGEVFMRKDLDQAASVLHPFYDSDLSILYLAGKGDGTIRYFELTQDPAFPGFCHYLSDFRTSAPQKGVCWLPKRCLDTSKAEIACFYRLTRDTVQPVSMQVPRKNPAQVFQDDLYPECPSGEKACEAEAYFNGENHEPKMKSLKPEKAGGRRGRGRGARGGTSTPAAEPTLSVPADDKDSLQKRCDMLEEANHDAEETIAALKSKLEALQAQLAPEE
eukprot:255841_1